jgi:primosomal protein N' (replication factor Y)
MEQRFARVVTDDPTDKELDYRIPEQWANDVQIGSRVRVPLRSREVLATVVAVVTDPSVPEPKSLADLVSDLPIVSPQLIELGRFIADYYGCSIEAAIRTMLPTVVRQAQLGFKRLRVVALAREPSSEELASLEKRAPRQGDVLRQVALLKEPILWKELVLRAATTDRTIQQLVQRGWLRIDFETQERDPYGTESFVPTQSLSLNPAQRTALELVIKYINDVQTRPILLHGVTGSGKTEIYLQAIEHCLARGSGALVLVPEISLTPQTVERFKMRFSSELIAVLHSHLSGGERHDEWHKLNSGRARIAIGPRSAVFAPVSRLGLIVVDEEHENSYKQEETPRYQARDLAVMRARLERCAVVLGSATPSIESYHNATTGKYQLIKLDARVDDRQLPLIRIVDMRQEYRRQTQLPVISNRLGIAIEDRLARNEQTILFLNRRGFASSLVCRQCGFVCQCPNCSIALTFHLSENRLKCHLCGNLSIAPKKCPECQDPGIRYAGYGTEKIEGVVQKLFPKANTARMDADTMARRNAYRETLGAFRAGKIDILIGTQMIAKGLDFPKVTLVGILNADIGLHLPDFRAGERTFQLLTQVSGRAGRGETSGEVYVQSSTPFSPSIQFARHHDFTGFWEQEIEFRERCEYPPFVHLIIVQIRSEHQRRAEFSAETLHRRLAEKIEPTTMLHPVVPAPIERAKGYYRFQIMLRSKAALRLSRTVRAALDQLTFPEDVLVSMDVDPYSLM